MPRVDRGAEFVTLSVPPDDPYAEIDRLRAVIREAIDVFRAANWNTVGFAIEQAAVGEPATDDYNAFELRIYAAIRALVQADEEAGR